jgi:hypothetical protein
MGKKIVKNLEIKQDQNRGHDDVKTVAATGPSLPLKSIKLTSV